VSTVKFNIEHPAAYLPSELTHKLRDVAAKAEEQRTLHVSQLNMIYEQRWFNLYVPKELGGLELAIPDILKIEECLAWSDASTAWVVTLCSGAAWFVGFLDQEVAKKVFADDQVCFAGSGMTTGTASLTKDGYEINGYWKYASGALHATVFTANCLIQKDGAQVYHDDGTPVVRSFLLWRNEVTIHRTWNSMGMVATGSHSFEIRNLTVPENRSFIIDWKHAVIRKMIFRYPFLQLAETTLAVNISGMTVKFLDVCGEFFDHKMMHKTSSTATTDFHHALNQAKIRMSEYRRQFYEAVEGTWQTCNKGVDFSQAELKRVSEVSHILAHESRQLVNDLYPFCGLTASDTRQEINRVWRNIHTASQHALFTSRPLNNLTVL
jgi:hypothetical protein